MDNRKLTVAITSWNRYEQTLRSFVDVANSHMVDEIVIVDDCSDIDVYNRLKTAVEFCDKVKLYRNLQNIGCYHNKRRAVELSSNKFVIIFDSDNILDDNYLQKIYEQPWFNNTILAPDFAKPNFSYQAFGGAMIDKTNVADYMDEKMFSTALNTFNMFVNRDKFLEVFDSSIEPVTCDSIYFNYCWLKAGNRIHIVKGLEYFHEVHDQSHYKNFVSKTPVGLLEEIENNLRQLK